MTTNINTYAWVPAWPQQDDPESASTGQSGKVPTGTSTWHGPSKSGKSSGAGGGQAASTSPTGSINSLMSKLMALGTGADLAFLVYAMQIDQMNKASNDSLKQIQQTSNLRDVMSKELSKLRELQSYVNKCADANGNAEASAVISEFNQRQGKGPVTYDKNDPKWQQAEKDFWAVFPRYNNSFSLDADGNVTSKKGSDLLKDEGDGNGCMFNKDVIKSAVDNLGDDMKQLDADREIEMILSNALVNKKTNAVAQLTNLIKSTHEIDKSIITNLR